MVLTNVDWEVQILRRITILKNGSPTASAFRRFKYYEELQSLRTGA